MKTRIEKEVFECDNCGVTIDSPDCEIKFDFGYGSIYDGKRAEYHFCPDCASLIYKEFQKRPPIGNVNFEIK